MFKFDFDFIEDAEDSEDLLNLRVSYLNIQDIPVPELDFFSDMCPFEILSSNTDSLLPDFTFTVDLHWIRQKNHKPPEFIPQRDLSGCNVPDETQKLTPSDAADAG